MLVESIFEDIKAERLVKVLEENFSQVVTFTDDDSILAAQIAEATRISCRSLWIRLRKYLAVSLMTFSHSCVMAI